MSAQFDGAIDEALQRLHHFGPEWNTRLSNHGPMVVESMVRHGHAEDNERWLDAYVTKLDPMPTASHRITAADLQTALGDPSRLGDWVGFFRNELTDAAWQDVLAHWWAQLLPGIAASATHSVIRLGHNVRTLRDHGESEVRLEEFAQCLAYWAGRWHVVPGTIRGDGLADLPTALTGLPSLGRAGSFPDLLADLGSNSLWPECAAARVSTATGDIEGELKALIVAATVHYGTNGYQDPIMLVHAATAPNAVLRILPSLPQELWPASLHAAWTATAAITTIYNPTGPNSFDPPRGTLDPEAVFARAVDHGDEHVIKLADTALDAHNWNPTSDALGAAVAATIFVESD